VGTRRETAAERVSAAPPSWRDALPSGLRPYAEAAPIAAFLLGVSSGFPYTMIGATLTTRLAQHGIEKSTVTAFTLGFLAYNLKFLWAWVVDGVRIPLLGRLGQRVSWLVVSGALVMAAIANLALQDPSASIAADGDGRDPRRRRGSHVRHRDRRLPHRDARAAPARRRLGHVAVRLAGGLRRGGRARAGAGGARRMGGPPTSPRPRSRCRRC
jgi:hypothetical protein